MLEDAIALHECASALGARALEQAGRDVDLTLADAATSLDAMRLSHLIVAAGGSPRGDDGWMLQIPELAELLHSTWLALADAWAE